MQNSVIPEQIVVLVIKPIAFVTFSLRSLSLDLKVPNVLTIYRGFV